MTLSLTPAEAEAKITQVDETMIEVRRLATKILDSSEAMTASSWQGGRAQSFRLTMMKRNEDFNDVIKALEQVAIKGKEDIRAITAAEDGGSENTPVV